jgi:transcriptional regulator with XRE-family HTH domain
MAILPHPVLLTQTSRSQLDPANRTLDREVAMAIGIARRLRPPMKVFADEIRRELGWYSLSRRAVYAWERGEARVPAAALIAAAHVADKSVDELLVMVRLLERLGLQPGE